MTAQPTTADERLTDPPTTAAQAIGEAAVSAWVANTADYRNATAVILDALEQAGGMVLLPNDGYVALPVGLVRRAARACRDGRRTPSHLLAAELEGHLQ